MSGTVQALGIVIIIVILLLIFYQVYKKLTEKPPSETQPPGTTPGSSGLDVSGQFGGPGAATDALSWDPARGDNAGIYGFLAMMLADYLGKKLRDAAERDQQRKLDEKARAEAEEKARREKRLTDDFDNRLKDIDDSRAKKFEEFLRDEQNKVLRNAELTEKQIRDRIAAAEEKQRKMLEEQLRDEKNKVLREAGLTDEDIQRRVSAVEETQRKALEEKLRDEKNKTLRQAGLTDEDIQRRISAAQDEKRKALEEQFREEKSKALREAGLTDEDIQRRVLAAEETQRKTLEELLRDEKNKVLREAGLTDEDIQRRVSAAEETQRKALEEQLRDEKNKAIQKAGLTEEDIQRRVSTAEKTQKSLYEEYFREEQSRALREAGLTDEQIQRRVAEVEQKQRASLEENLRAQRSDLLAERGLSDEDVQRRVSIAEEKQRAAFEERLREERSSTLLDRGLTEDETARRVGEIDKKYKNFLEDQMRSELDRTYKNQGVTDDFVRDVEQRYKTIYEERFRVVESLRPDSKTFTENTTKRINKYLDETFRKQLVDIVDLGEKSWKQKIVDLEARYKQTFEAKFRSILEEQFRSSGLSSTETDAKIAELEKTYKQIFEEQVRKTNAAMNKLTPAERAKLASFQHAHTSSYEIRRMVTGEPQRGEDGRVDESRPAYSSAEGTNKISTKAMSNFSHLQLMAIMEKESPLYRNVLRALFKAKNGINALSDNPINRTLDKLANTKGGQALATGFEKIGDFLDFAQVVMTFTDAAFYNQFPDESALFTTDRMDGYSTFSLKSQLDVIGTYNDRMDQQNQETSGYGYPFAYVQFPLINGPLTQVDMNTPGFKGDVYYNQTRIETEIDAVREFLLRTTEPYKSSIRSSLDSYYGAGTSNAVSVDLTQSFVSYLKTYDPEFVGLTDSQRDSLYELAYSNVCTRYGGIVYIDYYKTDPMRKGRKRFQCGFNSASNCNANTVRWYDELNKGNVIGGEYGEWYTYSELLAKKGPGGSNILSSNTFESYTLGGNVYASDQTFITNGQQGACMVMNSTLYSICYSTAKEFQTSYKVDSVDGAGYDFATHRCVFTPAYCQSLGTCYRRSTKTCELPTEELNGVSMIFGTGGPREFIRLHGCTIEDGLGNTNPLSVIRSGVGVITEAVKRMDSWGPGLKASLASPTGSLMFATAVMGVTMASNKKAFAKLSGKAQFIAGGVMTGAMITLMVLVAVESLAGVYEQRAAPIDDALEYTVGGWRSRTEADPPSETGKAVRPMSFLDGWVTKPILYHPPGQMSQPYASVNAFPVKSGPTDTRGVVVTNSMFATQLSGSDLRNRLSTCLPDTQAVGRLQKVASIGPDLLSSIGGPIGSAFSTIANAISGSMTCPRQYTCYKDISGYPQFSFIRASSRAEANQMYCIQPFPIMSAEQDLSDPTIGPLAGPSTNWLTSNIWTSGEDASTPTFPMQSVTRGAESQNRWYYQLVYDKKKISRSAIWDDAKMSKYFDGTTINYIRQGTCQDDFYATDAAGNPVPVDPRCFGFLQVAFSNYKFSPMTLMATVSNAVIPP